MDFIDELKQFSNRVLKIRDAITTEEATKNSLILPFFQLLGYDVFNPLEFIPEFTADVGTKKGEKVDYAITKDGDPVILIEAKWCGEALEKHDSQLFRYFGTTSAKFGILTNGIFYKFYTDLNEPNKMDLDPFLEFNVQEISENLVTELKRFSKSSLDIEAATIAASELKYTNLIKTEFHQQRIAPSDDFVKYMMDKIYDGRNTQQAVERFRPLVKRGLNQYINDAINDTLKSALKSQSGDDSVENPEAEPDVTPDIAQAKERIATTQEELEALGIIKGLLHGEIDTSKLSFKDTESYFSVIFDGRVTKWICRLKLNGKKKLLIFPPTVEEPFNKETKHEIATIDNLSSYKQQLIISAQKFAK